MKKYRKNWKSQIGTIFLDIFVKKKSTSNWSENLLRRHSEIST